MINAVSINPKLAALEQDFANSILTEINDPYLSRHQIRLWIKRDDLLHPIISGNKWRKLKYSLQAALQANAQVLVSMGGNYSNYLHALAYVGHKLNLNTKAYVRGEHPDRLTSTLQDATNWGMELEFISRTDYRRIRQTGHPELKSAAYWLPEGGASALALKGVAEVVSEIKIAYDFLCVPCGTGCTLAGLISHTPLGSQVLGFAALPHATYLEDQVQSLVGPNHYHWAINHNYHGGGFAKTSTELIQFIAGFQGQTGIVLEPIYTGKMLYGIYDLINKGFFKSGQCIVAIHTGGLQGNRGFSDGKNNRT